MITKFIRSKSGVAVVVLLLTFILAVSAYAQSGLTFFVTGEDISAFPQVVIRLRAVELGNKAVSSLNTSTLAVYENGQQVSDLEITPQVDGPISYVFVIDQGRLSNYANYFQLSNIRQVISTLVSGGYFNDGHDTVMVLGRQNINTDQTVTLLPATKNATELTTWVANFNFDRGTGATKGLLGVDDAIRKMNELVPVPGSQTTAVIFITRYIEDPSNTVAPTSAQNTASEARRNFTSIYVFQTDPNQYFKETLQVLANGSDGQYAALTRNNYLNAISTVYQAIDAQRAYYSVSYRSPVADSGGREITINTPGRPSEGVFGEYEITLQPPVVNITEPVVNTTIRREAGISGEDNVPTFDITHIRVIAKATWVDGYPRMLKNAMLYVGDELEDTAELKPGMNQFEFDWDLSDVTTEGLNSVTLEVRVEDELGLTAADTAQVNVEVVIPENLNSFWSRLSPTWTAIGAVVICLGGILVLGAIGGGLYFYTKRSSSAGADEEADLDEVMPTIFAGDSPEFVLATLTVLEGPGGLIGELFKISTFVTTLGRDPSQTDIAFYPDEASSVSRVHCLIELDDDNSFRITDQDSPSGTRLNGRALKPDVSVVLADEDEIVLGSLAHRGVKLRFNFPPKESDGPVLGDADDRTHLLGDQDLGEWEGLSEE
jgi:hypothetical protein